MNPTDISCLSFRKGDQFLAVASSETVHIFWLDPVMAMTARDGLDSQLQRAVGTVAPSWTAEAVGDIVRVTSDSLVPKVLSDTRSFAIFRLPDVDDDGRPSVDVRS